MVYSVHAQPYRPPGQPIVGYPSPVGNTYASPVSALPVMPRVNSFSAPLGGSPFLPVQPRGNSYVAAPPGAQPVNMLGGSILPPQPRGNSYVAAPPGAQPVNMLGGSVLPVQPRGNSYVAAPQGAQPVNMVGSVLPVQPRGNSYVAAPQGAQPVNMLGGPALPPQPRKNSYVAAPQGAQPVQMVGGSALPQPANLTGGPRVPQAAPMIGGQVGGGQVSPGNIQRLLQNRSELKTAVVNAFKAVSGGRKGVDISGLIQLRSILASQLGIPESVFGSIDDDYTRFDFEGTGYLEANNIYKLIKFHLYEYARQQDNAMGRNTVPMKSPEQAGYVILRSLGEGNQASLKLATDRHGNQRCLKCFPKASLMNMFSLQDMLEEFECMKRLACKGIARSFEIFQDHSAVYMVNEVYMGGDFRTVRERASARIGLLHEYWWKDLFRQCLEALHFMHQQAMMHCDIKEPNLMLRTENYSMPQVVLIDFGVSKAMTKKETGIVSGTPGYMPPETMNLGKWYPGGDVFSLGVVIFQMMSGKIPDDEAAKRGAPMIGLFLEGASRMEDVQNFVNNRRPPFHLMQASPGLQQVTMRMLEKNHRARPKAPALLKDPWFSAGGVPTAGVKNPEMMMQPEHPLATVGITEEMMR